MKKLLILSILLIVGCEEAGITSNGLTDGTAVTDTLYVYDTLIVNYDTTIFVIDTVYINSIDCDGVEGGTAELDNCNVCDTDKTNDCVPDCEGVWGGDAHIDECGVCAGDGFSNGYYCRDLNVLQDFNDLNANLSGQPLEIGSQNWTDGRLDSLDLSGIGLTSIPQSIGNLNSLVWLMLYDNQLTSIPESIGDLSSLEVLTLWENQLTSIPDRIGDLSSLEVLTLSANQLTSIPDRIGDLSHLEVLNLYENQLTSIPQSIGDLNSLFLLVLSDNQLTSLPESLCSIYSNLTVFNINTNFLCGELPSCLIDVNIGEQDCP